MIDKLILASSSPRRVELLTECRIKFETVNHDFDEDSVKEKNPVKLAEILSLGKAQSIALKSNYYDKYILGVDTIVAYKNHILGKPRDRAEADKFIRLLSNKTHKVISGISIVNSMESVKMVKSSISKVAFIKFEEKFIKYYLDNNLWAGYAGGYAIQSLFSLFAKKIQGSYSNIVGLPVDVLYKMLKSINYNFIW